MTKEILKKHLLTAINSSINAGNIILDIYNNKDFEVQIKDDNSPLTIADKQANDKICLDLELTNIPILSEEIKSQDFSERKNWDYLWIVDPLDGTKEFIKKNDEFTVNIALVKNNKPIMGVIYVPVFKTLYFALENLGSFKCEITNTTTEIISIDNLINESIKLPKIDKTRNYTVVASRSHLSTETQLFIDKLKQTHTEIDIISKGSSLKLCMIAEGKADIYPRFAPTMEWDIAAGHAIILMANGTVTVAESKEDVIYNKKNLLNSWFIAELK